ncbi:MAG: hypothetical protein C0624_06675 [Desulfuromonas sp.]|nr:MAG: hypothetical protein C0624_06675 [Desulfuromonas sp.]
MLPTPRGTFDFDIDEIGNAGRYGQSRVYLVGQQHRVAGDRTITACAALLHRRRQITAQAAVFQVVLVVHFINIFWRINR